MNKKNQNQTAKCRGMSPGFTLIELMVAMAVAAIAMTSIYGIYVSVTESYSVQRELANMQQNLRSAMYLIKNDLRNSSRDPRMTGNVGITDVGLHNPDADSPNGYPGITMTSLYDTDRDGIADPGVLRRIRYRVFDTDGDGRRELFRQDNRSSNPTGWDLVFDGVEDIGFAFAFDNDNDLDLDRSTTLAGPGTVMWAVDTDAVVGLDTNLDNLPDGDINELDDGDNNDVIDNSDGDLGTQIPLRDIRAVKIWILARSRRPFNKFNDNSTYTVGNKVIDMSLPANDHRDNFRHKLLVNTVAMQNRERRP